MNIQEQKLMEDVAAVMIVSTAFTPGLGWTAATLYVESPDNDGKLLFLEGEHSLTATLVVVRRTVRTVRTYVRHGMTKKFISGYSVWEIVESED